LRIVLTRREALDIPDGINIFLFSLADALQHRGHEVIMVSTAANDEPKIREYFAPRHLPKIVSLGTHKTIGYRQAITTWLSRGKPAIASLRPDVVLMNGVLPMRFAGLNVSVSHDAEKRLEQYPLLRHAYKWVSYRKADVVVATCTEVRTALAAEAGLQEDRIVVIPTCVRLETYINKPYAERKNAVLHMGTVDYKNPMSTLRAFKRIATGDRKLYITGKVTPEIREFIAGLDAETAGRIELLGYVSMERLLELLGTVKVVSIPSIYTAAVASPTVIESLASGTPVVTTDSISKDVMEDGYNGWICDPSSDVGMAGSYERLLVDGDCWRAVAGHALESAQKFSADSVADAYMRVFQAHRTAAA
jgi:glycosyltransferase involved in cell wall biosynthesis